MKNKSGIRPLEFKVLIKPKLVEEKTTGGIFIPETTRESEEYKTVEGRIVAVSALAFNYADPEEWGDGQPKVGDAVLYAKFAGSHVKGKDGEKYVLVNDKDITARIEE